MSCEYSAAPLGIRSRSSDTAPASHTETKPAPVMTNSQNGWNSDEHFRSYTYIYTASNKTVKQLELPLDHQTHLRGLDKSRDDVSDDALPLTAG